MQYTHRDDSETRRIRIDLDLPSMPAPDPLAPTVFHEDWWLAAATDNHYEAVEVTAGGRTVGRLPYFIRRKFRYYSELREPALTYFLGPGFDEGSGSENNRFLKRHDIIRELLGKLPSTWLARIKCHGGITDALAFQEAEFRVHVQFTHLIAPAPIESVWNNLRDKTRNVIRRAEKELTVDELSDPKEFVSLYSRNLASRGVENRLGERPATRVLSAALERKRGRILVARDPHRNIQAANFCAWDANTSYYMLTTRVGQSGNGASSLLLWDAIKRALGRGRTFDFAGVGQRSSILFYAGFGATIQPRYVAVRFSRPCRLVTDLKHLFVPAPLFY
ncbi:MAG TPA: GNAT family N-acetyltransferase [Bryobacteraceae bacterium]|nr:GNAT family N-acetyltransferase [Bryobacteraceae bacterium]